MPPSVELVRGAVLAGRVNVDGAPPRKPVRLRIKLESIGEVTACLPDAVTAALSASRDARDNAVAGAMKQVRPRE